MREQIDPDPDFSTVKFPNPEEGKSTLNLALATAKLHQSTVVLANDPDADRLACAELQPRFRLILPHCNRYVVVMPSIMQRRVESFQRQRTGRFARLVDVD